MSSTSSPSFVDISLPNLALDAAVPIIQATLDSLAAHIAILDEQGTVVAVNAPWRRFAQNNGFVGNGAGLGANYLGVCATASGKDSEEASEVLEGIRAVIRGRTRRFLFRIPLSRPQRGAVVFAASHQVLE